MLNGHIQEFITQLATGSEHIKQYRSLIKEKWKIQLNGSHNQSSHYPWRNRSRLTASSSHKGTTNALQRLVFENSSCPLCVRFPTLPSGKQLTPYCVQFPRGNSSCLTASSFREQLTPSLRPVPNITLGGNNSCHLCVQFPPLKVLPFA